ncbi:MAG: pyridoxal phosphate-dependent aminotransferase [Planctomycetes bacterium]|nr:pyridoxal phosphate-dependent aminotransferase [Planctomycetota bacterium]
MRRNIVHPGADSLTYEIRSIVAVGKKMCDMGQEMVWENIGDPVAKGENIDPWIKETVHDVLDNCKSWAYCDSQGELATREILADFVNQRGGAQISPEDILFFNGLGDAISKIFSGMRREARILGPSPAYSTHSSGEAAHSGYEHLTYRCDPSNNWLPDLQDIRNKVQYNDTIAGILLISPNNPTGSVYPREILEGVVEIAREFDLMLINDEIYSHIIYNGAETFHLSEIIGDVPGIILRGISKELPWPGSRCGWIEVLNKDKDPIFSRYFKSLVDSKMLEVCSTSLPQAVIPRIYKDERFPAHLERRAKMFEQRANEAYDILSQVDGVSLVKPQGAFYVTVVFNDNALHNKQSLPLDNREITHYLQGLLQSGKNHDHRFAYYLMASFGICVVPLSSFCCKHMGFRFTLLEMDDKKRVDTYKRIAQAVTLYLNS